MGKSGDWVVPAITGSPSGASARPEASSPALPPMYVAICKLQGPAGIVGDEEVIVRPRPPAAATRAPSGCPSRARQSRSSRREQARDRRRLPRHRVPRRTPRPGSRALPAQCAGAPAALPLHMASPCCDWEKCVRASTTHTLPSRAGAARTRWSSPSAPTNVEYRTFPSLDNSITNPSSRSTMQGRALPHARFDGAGCSLGQRCAFSAGASAVEDAGRAARRQ